MTDPKGLISHQSPPPGEYRAFLADIKTRVTLARIQAARSINRELINLYWDIGRAIVEKQVSRGWGESVVEMLSADLQRDFPSLRGFSPRNIWDMRRFYLAYCDPEILRQAVAELKKASAGGALSRRSAESFLRQLVAEVPWGHHLILLTRTQNPEERIFYLRATNRFGWSRNVLLNQIMAGAYNRSHGKGKTHNFRTALPDYLAEQADETLKSSYNLEFLSSARRSKKNGMIDFRPFPEHAEFLEPLADSRVAVLHLARLKRGPAPYRPRPGGVCGTGGGVVTETAP